MKNKYLRRGILLLVSGVAFNALGWFIKVKELGMYGWAMIIGTVLFGLGFLLIFYSLVRKFERQAILEERAAQDINKENED
jgi:hypothetical protein